MPVLSDLITNLLNKLPDGILIKVLCFIFDKLIGKVPEDKQKVILEEFANFIIALAEALAKGAAEGFVSQVQHQYGPYASSMRTNKKDTL